MQVRREDLPPKVPTKQSADEVTAIRVLCGSLEEIGPAGEEKVQGLLE